MTHNEVKHAAIAGTLAAYGLMKQANTMAAANGIGSNLMLRAGKAMAGKNNAQFLRNLMSARGGVLGAAGGAAVGAGIGAATAQEGQGMRGALRGAAIGGLGGGALGAGGTYARLGSTDGMKSLVKRLQATPGYYELGDGNAYDQMKELGYFLRSQKF